MTATIDREQKSDGDGMQRLKSGSPKHDAVAFGKSAPPSRGVRRQFPLAAAVAKTDLAPLDSRAQRPFNRVVGGLYTGLL